MSKIKFIFGNPNSIPETDREVIGCSSNGFSTYTQCVSSTEKGFAVWKHELPGKILNGTYQSVLHGLSMLPFSPEICIVLYKRAGGFEDFLNQAVRIQPNSSFIGGGASFAGEMQEGILLPEAEDACILAVSAKNYKIEKLNIFDDLNIRLEIEPVSNRSFSKIRELPNGKWQNAVSYYREKQVEFGINEENFENLCFSDKNRT